MVFDLCRFLSWEQDKMIFFTGGRLIWDFEEDRWMFEVQNALMVDLFLTNTNFLLHKTFIDGLELCGLLVNYCGFYQLFVLSIWWHPFTAEDPLVNGKCGMLYLSWPERKGIVLVWTWGGGLKMDPGSCSLFILFVCFLKWSFVLSTTHAKLVDYVTAKK